MNQPSGAGSAVVQALDSVNGTGGAGDVPALRKGLSVLQLLADAGPLTMAEIQRGADLNKTMTFRLLRVLRELGYVRQDAVSRRYALALKLLELGNAVAAGMDVVSVSQPLLDDLAAEFDETINLGVMDGGQVVYVAMVERQHGLRMTSRVGGRDGLHSTSIGKAILAYLPDAQRDAILSTFPLPRLTPRTVTDVGALRAELIRTRVRGYAIDDGENEEGGRCVGVPILGADGMPFAGLSVSGPSSRIDDERIKLFADRLWAASGEIARRLGRATGDQAQEPGVVSTTLDHRSPGTASAAP